MLIIGQVVISIVLIILVILQERGAGLGTIFGGGGASYHTRRGLEKFIFWATIISAVIFAALAILNLFVA